MGQVTSGKKRWSDNAPVAGQQFEYAFDDIGNRLTVAFGGDNAGQNLHAARYTNNLLNQITSRDVPGFLQVLGSAASNATVTLWGDNGSYARAGRKGEYFRGEVPVANDSAAVWLAITNLAVLQNGTNADTVSSTLGSLFLPQTPETSGYDFDGNLTNDGRWQYSWDAENRLTKIESRTDAPAASKRRLEFTYDERWRRTQKVVSTHDGSGYVAQYTNRFLYDGWNLVAVLDGGNNLLQSYVWGTDLNGTLQGAGGVGGLISMTVHFGANAGTYFYCFDGNGNVVALVNAADGSMAARYEYGPFGEVIRATGPMAKANPFRFSTKYQDDETDLIYYGYRYYNASIGRWLNRDQIGEKGGVNVYAFAPNDAVNDVDNLGLVKCACTSHPNASADKMKSPNDLGRTICIVSPPKVSVKECCSTGALWWKEYKYKLTVEAPASCKCDVYFLAGIDPDRRKGRSGRTVRQHEAAHVQYSEDYANALERLYDSLKNRCVTGKCINAMNNYIQKENYYFLAVLDVNNDQLEYHDYPLDYPGLEDYNTSLDPSVRQEAITAYKEMLTACGWK